MRFRGRAAGRQPADGGGLVGDQRGRGVRALRSPADRSRALSGDPGPGGNDDRDFACSAFQEACGRPRTTPSCSTPRPGWWAKDDESEPAGPVRALRLAIADAHALLFATPEYNGSIPGQLKNAVDWASRPYGAGVLTGKPVAVVAASPTPYGAARAHAELRKVLGRADATVLDREFSVAYAHEAFGPDGRLRDAELNRRLAALLADLQRTLNPVCGMA